MTVSAHSSSDRRAAVKLYKLKDGREIRYRTEAERRLIEETQRLQIALEKKSESGTPKRSRR
ncbi:hypothetical protein BSP109_03042 [Brevibacterium sp. Mu109]|uniref:hypothetical protein n=1 Tax=Brevibacterium sp. Mu109 TaxID=1255669 RepID=UPI000C6A3D74|nr:hypothetical protein [Brevibacterium sp. Mu109]SMX97934.1 hypothetical protein BSP109_03042 [Brevibacterium sp. Mu109]